MSVLYDFISITHVLLSKDVFVDFRTQYTKYDTVSRLFVQTL